MMRPSTFTRACGLATVVCAIAVPVRAQSALEYNVKAALLLNFARFIEWPDGAFANPGAPVEVCVFAPSPFGDALTNALEGELVSGRTLTAREVRTAADSAGCHLLFVPDGSELRAAALVRHTGPHTVTVGETRRFEEIGGAVSFVVESGRVRFNVNLQPVEHRGIRISARMLKLANRVDRATPAK
ncbi:MAG TPA: YfiR family protein [Vicinamibacterales bacterium]|nr:YfiR family protein [Vicinamibacterales bacterium]